MKFSAMKFCAVVPAALGLCLMSSFVSLAAIDGHLDGANPAAIVGWACDTEDEGQAVDVIIEAAPADADKAEWAWKVTADGYRADIEDFIGDGDHGFSCGINWSDFSDDELVITAYAISGDRKVPLRGVITYNRSAGGVVQAADRLPSDSTSTDELIAKTAAKAAEATTKTTAKTAETTTKATDKAAETATKTTDETKTGKKKIPADKIALGPGYDPSLDTDDSDDSSGAGGEQGESLGMFTTTGYCNCELCSGGSGLTYSGTVPQANHTIAADINLFPLGTKLMIDGIVYTVEDIGSDVGGNKIDIYYADHSEAVAHGTKTQEVFRVVE